MLLLAVVFSPWFGVVWPPVPAPFDPLPGFVVGEAGVCGDDGDSGRMGVAGLLGVAVLLRDEECAW